MCRNLTQPVVISMTNAQIAKTWFSIIALAFCWGFYCAAVDRPSEGGVLIALQLASCIFGIWGMFRLLKSVPKAKQ